MHDLKSLKSSIEKELKKSLEEISIISLVDLLVEYAYATHASDVHVEPAVEGTRIRFRLDGLLTDMFDRKLLTKELSQEIISRIKVLSGLRTDEHLMPQDGRFRVRIGETIDVDVRVSIMPTYYGENAILRVLAETTSFSLEGLGIEEADLKKIRNAMKRPFGMILANGPTGSGKTTTLYTILKELNKPDVSIITIEDPIEYSLQDASQIQVNEQAGFKFANGLRSILRQDPNIIMVGEIRDEETASIAVNAALTGHLLLSTLHTNDAATTFPRLTDMGVPPFLVASTVNIAMGQRLVRVICPKCKEEKKLDKEAVKSASELIPEIGERKLDKFFIGKGCDACGNTGYQGRVGIREVLEVNEEIRQLVMNRADAHKIKEAAVRNGMTTMVDDGLKKATDGVTSLEEVLRVIHE